MLVKKVLTITLHIDKYEDMFNSDFESTFKRLISDKYINVCYKSILVKEILRIIRYSDMTILDNMLNGTAYVDVEVEVLGTIFNSGELLNGSKIVKIYKNAMDAEHPDVGVKIKTDNQIISKHLNVGDIIPIVIEKSSYTINSKQISVIGVPYTPTVSDKIIFNILDDMSDVEINKINYMYEYVKEETIKFKETEKLPSYKKLFSDLMYPYKSKQDITKQPLFKKLKFNKLSIDQNYLKCKSGDLIMYPDELHKSEKAFYKTSSVDKEVLLEIEKKMPSIQIVDTSAYTAVSFMLNKYLLYLLGINDISREYKSPEDIRKNYNYCKICKQLKV